MSKAAFFRPAVFKGAFFRRAFFCGVLQVVLIIADARAQVQGPGQIPPGSTSMAQASDSTAPMGAIDSLIGRWNRHEGRHNPSVLYLHTDKSIYVPNSYVLFTGFVLRADRDTTLYHTLYVALVDPEKKKTVASDRFVMRDVVGSGALFLPDTLAPGPYLLEAYTNVLPEGGAQALFRSVIRIRSPQVRPFSLTVSPMDRLAASPAGPTTARDSIYLKCRVKTSYGGLASGARFTYTLAADGRTLQTGEKRIDPFGEVSLALPGWDSLLSGVLLTASVQRDTQSCAFWMPVTLRREGWTIHYYPEGGSLVSGHESQIGVGIRDAAGRGVSAQCVLLEDSTPVNYFRTNEAGLGVLDYVPDKDKNYTVQLADAPTGAYLEGVFPPVRPEGFALDIPRAVVRDSISVYVHAPGPGMTCMLMVCDDEDVLYASQLRLGSEEGVIRLPVDSSRKGIASVILFDDGGKPVAERAVYFPGHKLFVSVQPDSVQYHTGSKVSLHIKVTDEHGKGVESVFSLGAVLANRMGADSGSDIIHYASLADLPGYLSGGEGNLDFDSDSAMELALLTRFADRHHWNGIVTDTASMINRIRPTDYGYVFYKDKPPGRPVQLMLMGAGPGAYHAIKTDSSGYFQLPPSMLIAPVASHTLVSVVEPKNQDRYDLEVMNTYERVNRTLPGIWYYPAGLLPKGDDAAGEALPDDKEFNSIKTIKTIVIHGREDNEQYYAGNATCNDYVCPFGVLNCPNHPYGKRPVIGETYLYFDYAGGTARYMYYAGCVSPKTVAPFLNEVRTIHLAPEFYKPDGKGSNAPGLESLVNSTLFWVPLAATDKNGETTLTFYTQQLPGTFYVVLEGLSDMGPISGRSGFRIL